MASVAAGTERSLTRQEATDLAISNFETVVAEVNGLAATLECPPATRIFMLADAMNKLDKALTPEVMQPIMNLMGSRVGFRTDLDKGTKENPNKRYSIADVKEVVKEAILYGAHMTGNEVNIISNAMYCTKEHFMRRVRELPGLTNLEATVGTPIIANGEAKVRCSARWRINGMEQTLGFDPNMPCTFAIRVYDRPGGHSVATDQAIGKATRKLYKRIYEMATGSTLSTPEGEADDGAREVEAQEVGAEQPRGATEKLKDKMKAHSSPDATTSAQAAEQSPEFKQAYAKLNLLYDENGKAIDAMLAKFGATTDLIGLQNTTKGSEIVAVIRTAEAFRPRKDNDQ